MTREAYACRRDLLQTVDVGSVLGTEQPCESCICPAGVSLSTLSGPESWILGRVLTTTYSWDRRTEEPVRQSTGWRWLYPPSVCASAASSDVSERHRSGVRQGVAECASVSRQSAKEMQHTAHGTNGQTRLQGRTEQATPDNR